MMDKEPKENTKVIREIYRKKQCKIVAWAVILQIGMLVVLKYTPFLSNNINTLFAHFKIPISFTIPTFTVPIGLSFFTLQAVSYIFDVYREKITADTHLGRLALYMAFFPQIMEGPICRYQDTAPWLWQGNPIKIHLLHLGCQRILFGLFKKIVIADRLNLFIQTVFNDYVNYDGGIMMLAMILYTCQLYCEFSGTMDVVIGSSQIFGITLPENFRQPFFSMSISEFWQRWHITLGTWFKDYIFYPLSMSKPLKKLTSKARKKLGNHFGPLLSGAIALFIVWFCNGIWHGAGWNYIFFGMYHFALILLANITNPLSKKILHLCHINHESLPWKFIRILRTCILVCIGELFFRANGLRAGLAMFTKMITQFTFTSFQNGTALTLGMDSKDFIIVIIAVGIVLVNSLLKEKGLQPREWLAKQRLPIRWTIYYCIILFIIIFGAYGTGYVPVDPIYANF